MVIKFSQVKNSDFYVFFTFTLQWEGRMSKGKYLFITMVLLAMGSLASGVNANVQPCGGASNKTGKTYKINGTGIAVRSGPGTNYEKRINQKATSILKTTRYIEIDNSVTVYE